jgi:diaminopimelate decarboxylase
MRLTGTSHIGSQGHLTIGGCDTVELAKTFGTPLYVYDEALIRENSRRFVKSFEQSGFAFQVAYASKAFSCIAMAQLAAEENLSLDVVSSGELYTALQAGFPAERIHFHGNNKSEEELRMALEAGVGCYVVDNFYEMALLHDLASASGIQVNVMLRLTPGIEVHTHEYIATGQEDSKFGFGVTDGQAMLAIRQALAKTHFNLLGIHVHIGSQIFDTTGFVEAIKVIRKFLDSVRQETGYEVKVLNLGGGFGIRYTDEDDPVEIETFVETITQEVAVAWSKRNLPNPEIWIEPGRGIVGNAGTTLYSVGSIKQIPGIRTYVAVDGGMTDNIRPALYQAKYEALLANKASMEATETVSIAGKCCESGDMLIWDIDLPQVTSGDILAVLSTGAYGYSMASNYNRLRRPAVVFVRDGIADLVVERETYEDLVRHDRKRSVLSNII